jgi:N4-gp56 family major capsid protein
MPASYNSNSRAEQLADALATAPNAKGQLYARKLEDGAARYDDFKMLEGPEGSESVFWTKRDLTKSAGDKITFSVQSDLAGPGVIGEQELTGKTSMAKYGTFEVVVDFHRDAHEVTQKQKKFLAAGQDVEDHAINKLKVKMGRWRMDEMKIALIHKAVGNVLRPNKRGTRDALTAADTLSPHFLVAAKPVLQRLGGRPMNVARNKEGSPVHRHLFYASDVAMAEIRNDTTYLNALSTAQQRGDLNPIFSGRLVDWNNIGLFEHITVHPDADDKISDATAPLAILGSAFSVNSAHSSCVLVANSSNTLSRYFEFFPGYDYIYFEGQTPNPDSATYYAWIVNPDNSVGFVSYTGSSNSGNSIALAHILSKAGSGGTSTLGTPTLGNINASGDTWGSTPGAGHGTGSNTSADFNYTDSFTAGAYIIPANANGTPIGYSFLFGKGAGVRAYAQTDTYITQDRDYGFVNGRGYQGVWGQTPVQRTDGKTHGYLLQEHAIAHPGLDVPSL